MWFFFHTNDIFDNYIFLFVLIYIYLHIIVFLRWKMAWTCFFFRFISKEQTCDREREKHQEMMIKTRALVQEMEDNSISRSGDSLAKDAKDVCNHTHITGWRHERSKALSREKQSKRRGTWEGNRRGQRSEEIQPSMNFCHQTCETFIPLWSMKWDAEPSYLIRKSLETIKTLLF